ncbi:unnamed protein product [Hydatigera taeniaeformis]|uniref:Pecanex-like protein n=1 Tax=Hydatigena taeniaeformis TaxID=6205 RepID=A0A0R3X795_HYDTA|nr:unnamed protein product [Hydatigera taeniaeformis]
MSSLRCIDGIWKMLDEMALSDPSGYRKFWDLINAPKSSADPIPLYCGNIYMVDTEETVSVAMHPSVFKQYNFSRDRPNSMESLLDADQLIALIILYLQSEKHIQTVEGDRLTSNNLPKFSTEWSSRSHGSDDLMLESLNYKKFSFLNFGNHSPTRSKDGGPAHPPTISSHIKNHNNLIEEIKPQPHWKLMQTRAIPNAYEYSIQLPPGTKLKDCELDISPVSCRYNTNFFRLTSP